MTVTTEYKEWTFSKKLGYRFLFLYIVLYIYPYGFEYIRELTTSDISFWKGVTIWFGETVFGWQFNESNLMNGFDSKYDYSRFALIALMSVLGTGIWMFIDTKIKKSYNHKLEVLFHTILRYHVGLTLIIYGISKVFMLQFGEMDLNRLEGTIGNQDGMGFLWTFMSYSKFYTMTSGWIEVIGGVFLLFRKTTFIGAIILFVAMTNVVLIDIGYDVRVKMFAIHLLFMTLLLLAYHSKQLINFLLLNKSASVRILPPLFTSKHSKRIGYILKGSLLLYFIVSTTINFSNRIKDQTHNRYPSLTGFHSIQSYTVSNDSKNSPDEIWKSMSINGTSYSPETLLIKTESGERMYFSFEADTVAHTLSLYPLEGDTTNVYEFKYKKLSTKEYAFEGVYHQDTIQIKTTVKALKDYPLTARGIKWITDLE